VLRESLSAVGLVDASATWVLSNHDVVRHVTRYGGGVVGLARGRAALLTMLALPGSSYIYQGEELGLEQVDVSPAHRQDPAFFRGGEVGRDGCRVPMPWSGTMPPFGFGPGNDQPWLPQPSEWKGLTVEAQEADPDSTLAFYRKALAARREVTASLGSKVQMLTTAPGTLAFRRDSLVCMVNCGSRNARPPAEVGAVVLTSGPLTSAGLLPPDTAAWFRAGDAELPGETTAPDQASSEAL
jgi:alpha-glucosidase